MEPTHDAGGIQLRHGDDVLAARRVYRLTERTIDKRGQQMLLPEYVLEGWSTPLPEAFTPEQIMALYADHGTHEQFGNTPSQRSEFKTDMEFVRLPSGKFDTNDLVHTQSLVRQKTARLAKKWTNVCGFGSGGGHCAWSDDE